MTDINASNPEQIKKALEQELDAKLNEVADYVFSESQKNLVRNQSIDTSALMQNVRFDKSQFLLKEIHYNQDYAEYVEFGTIPHWPPPLALEGWVRRKLGVKEEDVARVDFLVRRKISIEGTKEHPFCRPAMRAAEQKYG